MAMANLTLASSSLQVTTKCENYEVLRVDVLMTACDCDRLGSSSPVCDVTTGQCPCRDNVSREFELTRNQTMADTRCSLCKADYYGLASGQGCTLCNCDTDGSSTSQCSEEGVCTCKETVVGIRCTECRTGYFHFSANGCM